MKAPDKGQRVVRHRQSWMVRRQRCVDGAADDRTMSRPPLDRPRRNPVKYRSTEAICDTKSQQVVV
jgi:hypothetical protein